MKIADIAEIICQWTIFKTKDWESADIAWIECWENLLIVLETYLDRLALSDNFQYNYFYI